MQKTFFQYKQRGGYTIIEMMIAISLFLVVVMSGMTALLNANFVHNKSRDMREILDNLSFIMEDMSRNLRTGYDYRCFGEQDTISYIDIEKPRSCDIGYAIAFEHQDGDPNVSSDQWVYKIEEDPSSGGSRPPLMLWKSENSGQTWVQLNPTEIVIDKTSGFEVYGAPSEDGLQPLVAITLKGSISLKGNVTPFTLRTSVSQRLIDI